MPIKDQKKAREYKRLWIARQRKALKEQNVEPVEPNKSQYYQAQNIKVLISLSEYLNLSKEKQKLWMNFNFTFADLSQGVHDIIQIMKLREDAENLINDYWKTAKSKRTQLTNSWNSLNPASQKRLINYWSQEKTRKDNNLLTDLEKQEQESKAYQQQIELAKFHEEQGKIKCECHECSAKKELQKQEKTEQNKYWVERESSAKQKEESNKEPCSDCGKYVKWLDEENSVCRKCLQNYEQ